MRTKDVLINDFKDLATLLQYLYMSEEHFIEVENAIGVPLRIRMDENLRCFCKNLNFPDLPESNWTEEMSVPTIMAIIDQLKEKPATEFPKSFPSRWEEIKTLTCIQLSLNRK